MVLTTPLIAELAVRGPVDVVATPASAGLLDNNPSVRRVIVYDKRARGARHSRVPADCSRHAGQRRRRRLPRAGLDAQRRPGAGGGRRHRVGFATLGRPATVLAHACPIGRTCITRRGSGSWPLPTRVRHRRTDPPTALSRRTPSGRPWMRCSARRAMHAPWSRWRRAACGRTKRWPYYGELARELAPGSARGGAGQRRTTARWPPRFVAAAGPGARGRHGARCRCSARRN